MPDSLTFKQKVFKSLYGMGLKNFGPTLLGDLKKGGMEWISFVQELLDGSDYPTRKLALQQLTVRGFVDRQRDRVALLALIEDFLARGMGDEKRTALKFVDQNLALFPTDDDGFRSKILALQRERDMQLSSLAAALLPRIGINLDDADMYRRH